MRTFLLLALTTFSLIAADHPNFTGSWKMNADKSDFGALASPTLYERKIEHKDPVIRMTVRQGSAMGERTVDVDLRTDGQETTNKSPTGEGKTIGKWNGRDLDLTTTRKVQGGDVVSHEIWSLSQDGKTLTSTTHMKTPRGNVDIKLVLDRQ
jgi:hypothetical protein